MKAVSRAPPAGSFAHPKHADDARPTDTVAGFCVTDTPRFNELAPEASREEAYMKLIGRAMLLAGIVFLAFFASDVHGQITAGGVVGTVKDPSGAVVKGATITLTNQATNVVLSTVSTSSGNYSFQNVPVGKYTLKAVSPGFRPYILQDVQVHVQNVITADIPLQLGKVNQAVTVTSSVPLLQAQDASLGQTISGTDVNDLPLNGRNWLSLTQLSAGTYAETNSNTDNPGQVEANGVAHQQVDYRLNGIDNNIEVFQSGANGQAGSVAPVPDAIQEFKLQDGNNSADFGQFAGAVVNAVVKSGSNRIQGDLWEYLRNEAFNANDYFTKQHGKPRQEYRQNQFGGTVGGPVMLPGYNGHNKTFFFFDYQHTGITQQASFTDTVPTGLMHTSNFTNLQDLIPGFGGSAKDALGRTIPHGTVLDPATTRAIPSNGIDPITGLSGKPGSYVRDPFYNCTASGCPSANTQAGGPLTGVTDFTTPSQQARLNIIPSSRLDPNAVALLNLLPTPNVSSAKLINNYFATPPAKTSINQYDIRIDENLTAKDLLWGVFSRSNAKYDSYQPFPGIAGGALQIAPNDSEPHYELALHYTHVFSPTLENDITAGYDHVNHDLTMPTASTLGIPSQFKIQGIPQIAGNGGLPTFEPSGFTSFGGRRYMPTIQTTTGLQLFDNLMKLHGKHEFHAGFEFNHIRGNIIQPAYSKGDFVYNGQYSDIPNQNSKDNGIADMLLVPAASNVGGIDNLGGMSSYTGSNYAGTRYFADYIAAYFQDNWRITPSLTLNLGLRWDYSSPYGESEGAQANFQENGGDGAGGIYYMPKKGCAVPRSASFNALLAINNITVDCTGGLRVNQAQLSNFGPRLGFAYRLRPSLVLRAGYGIAYGAFDSVGYGGTLGTNYPFQFVISNPPLTSQTPDLLPNGQPATIENTFGVINLQDPSTVTGQGLSLYGKQYHYKTPFVQSANLTVQDQFTSRDSIQVGYVGSLGRHLDAYGKQNAPNEILPPGVNENSILPLGKGLTSTSHGFNANMQNLSTISLSNYNSLQTVYQHQFKGGLEMLANYTYAKCMSDDGGNLSNGFRAQWLPGFGIGPDYSLCGNDSTHVVHISGEYALPFGRGRQFASASNRMADAVIGGWNLNYIFSYQSGQPVNIGCPTATTSDFGCDANLIAGQDPYAGPHNVKQWLNPKAFAQPPAAASIGQTDYSPLGGKPQQVRGPGFYNLDSSLFKNFTTSKETFLQFRLETFNTLNHPQFNQPGQLNFNNNAFSSITGARNGYRIVQLAGKFYF